MKRDCNWTELEMNTNISQIFLTVNIAVEGSAYFYSLVGCLGFNGHWNSTSVYIKPSPKEREKGKGQTRVKRI